MRKDKSTEIQYLSDPAPVSMADDYFDLVSSEHFWYRWRTDALVRYYQDSLGEIKRALDVGGGSGIFAKQIEAKFDCQVDVSDLNAKALAKVNDLNGKVYCYNIFDKHKELVGAYDAVFLMDVIEHIEDDAAFVRAAADHLRPGGRVFINVPAHQSLYSKYDLVNGHCRRYSKAALLKVFKGAGLNSETVKFWGLSLLPLLYIRKHMVANASNENVIEKGFKPPTKLFNQAFSILGKIENSFVPVPTGISLLATARV